MLMVIMLFVVLVMLVVFMFIMVFTMLVFIIYFYVYIHNIHIHIHVRWLPAIPPGVILEYLAAFWLPRSNGDVPQTLNGNSTIIVANNIPRQPRRSMGVISTAVAVHRTGSRILTKRNFMHYLI